MTHVISESYLIITSEKIYNLSHLDKYASLLLSCLYYTFSRIYQEGENIIWSVKKRERYEWSVRCLKKIITIYNYLPHSCLGPSWPWSYGSWIYNYLCNQCLSPLMLWVRIPLGRSVLNTALCDKVCQWLAAGRWFSPGTVVSSTNITEILLKVALSTTAPTLTHDQVCRWLKERYLIYILI